MLDVLSFCARNHFLGFLIGLERCSQAANGIVRLTMDCDLLYSFLKDGFHGQKPITENSNFAVPENCALFMEDA